MSQSWADRAEQIVFSLGEMLGLEAAAPLALWPVGVLLLSAGLGLLLALLLLGLHRPGAAREKREKVEDTVPEPSKACRAEEPKKRSRKRAGDKKVQRNGLAVEPQEEVKPPEVQSQDPAELKTDKAKKNKKKPKAPVKEAKSAPSERKESEEAGTWETKVSNREKRQQRRKDKAGDESGSPGGVEPSTTTYSEQTIITPEEPKVTIPPTPTNTPKATKTTTKIAPNTTKSTSKTSSYNTPASAAQRKEEPPAADVVHAVMPQMSPGWEEVLSVNGSGWRELAVSASVQPDSWNSLSSEHQDTHTSTWTHKMEDSWMIVDRPFPGLPTAVEPQAVPELSWTRQTPVDDEWSGLNSSRADPASDWNEPVEEWGNYEDQPAEGAVSTQSAAELQESDTEKDKDEPTAPGSGKAKKKKKKKKKLEDGGSAAQGELEVGVAKDQNTAGNILPRTVKHQEQESVAPPRATPRPSESEPMTRNTATPAQKKAEESWESPKQVKKKKARRET